MKIEAMIADAVKAGIKAIYGQDVPDKMVQFRRPSASLKAT